MVSGERSGANPRPILSRANSASTAGPQPLGSRRVFASGQSKQAATWSRESGGPPMSESQPPLRISAEATALGPATRSFASNTD
jgi:hypothetical protein